MQNHSSQAENCVDIAVFGLGPGGLSAAIEAAKLGLKVLAITQKRDYVRGQRFKVLFTPSTIGFLDSLENPNDREDTTFFEKLEMDQSLQLKDLERFLYKKLANYADLVTVVEQSEENPITAVQCDETSNMPYLCLLDGTRYYFTHLLGADGAKRTMSNLVSNGLNIPVTYQDCSQRHYPYHAAVQLFFTSKPAPIPKPAPSEQALGWNAHPQLPESLILSNKAKTKFSFTGEIPNSIFLTTDEQQLELLKNWAALQIAKEYKDPTLVDHLDYRQSKKYSQSKDKVKACAFTMNLSVCTQALFPLVGGGYYAPIGDARRSPDYQKAHGIHDAILAGIEFARGVSNQDMTQYQTLINEMDAALNDGYMYFAPFYTDVYSDCNSRTLSTSTSGSTLDSTDSETDTLDSKSTSSMESGSQWSP